MNDLFFRKASLERALGLFLKGKKSGFRKPKPF
jgi:hypothetical protein